MIIRHSVKESSDKTQSIELTLTRTRKGYVCDLVWSRKTESITDQITVSESARNPKRAYKKAHNALKRYAKL